MSDNIPSSNVANETWLEFIREASATKRGIEEASGRHRAVLKRAKAAGCNPAIIAAAIAAKRKDHAVVMGEVRDSVRVFNLVGITIAQTDLFGGWAPEVTEKAAADHDMFTAEERGYDAGKAGQDRHGNPFTAGSPFFQEWDSGWVKGQAAIAERMAPGASQADASRKRPDRAAKEATAPKAAERTGSKAPRAPKEPEAGKDPAAPKAPRAPRKRADGAAVN